MELIRADIDDAIKEAKKYQDFINILSFKVIFRFRVVAAANYTRTSLKD